MLKIGDYIKSHNLLGDIWVHKIIDETHDEWVIQCVHDPDNKTTVRKDLELMTPTDEELALAIGDRMCS